MIVMTMAITASVNASSRPFVTARASHTKSPLTENRYDEDDLSPVSPNAAGSVGHSGIDQSPGGHQLSWAATLVHYDAVYKRPPAPDFDSLPHEVSDDLDTRFSRIPFSRVRRYADYWALRDIEADHIRKLAYRNGLSDDDRKIVEAWWLARVATEHVDTMDRLGTERWARRTRQRRRDARRPRSKVFSQIWFNTIGPGGRCWFGNRYTTVRHYTFRLRWRA